METEASDGGLMTGNVACTSRNGQPPGIDIFARVIEPRRIQILKCNGEDMVMAKIGLWAWPVRERGVIALFGSWLRRQPKFMSPSRVHGVTLAGVMGVVHV